MDLADHRIEPLWVGANRLTRLPRAAVAAADVEHAPVGVAWPRRGIEDEIAERMDASVQLHAHQLARRSFERGVGRARIGPLDEHAFAQNLAGRGDRLR